MRFLISLSMILCTVFMTLHAADMKSEIYAVNFQTDGQGGGEDQLILSNGELQSAVIEKHFQFKPATYEIIKSGDVSFLKSTLKSKKHGTVSINAVVAADGCIAGVRVWSKPDKDPIIHPFTGKLKTE